MALSAAPLLEKRHRWKHIRTAKRVRVNSHVLKSHSNDMSAWWNINKIRHTILDFCELSVANAGIFVIMADNQYMREHFINITMWDFVKIRQLVIKASPEFSLRCFTLLLSAIKVLCGSMYYKRLLHSTVKEFRTQGISSLVFFTVWKENVYVCTCRRMSVWFELC